MNDSWPPQPGRLDAAKLLRQFKGAAIYSPDDWRTIEVELNDDFTLLVHLPEMAYGPEAQAMIENVLTVLPVMDDGVIESCISHQKETKANARNYQNALVLAAIESPDHVVLTYFATRIERIWTESFTRTGDGWKRVPGSPNDSRNHGRQTTLDPGEEVQPSHMHSSWPPQLGRLKATELFRQFERAPVLPAADWETIEVMINDDFSVVIALPEKSYGPESRAVIGNVLTSLPGMDDEVLKSCIEDQRNTKIDGSNYQNALVLVTIENPDHVVLSYFGTGVNTNWDETFTRSCECWNLVQRHPQ